MILEQLLMMHSDKFQIFFKKGNKIHLWVSSKELQGDKDEEE